MAPKPVIEQVPSRTCGCYDCLIDYPSSTYGFRPPRTECNGPWNVRYRSTDGRLRLKRLPNRKDAQLFATTGARRNAS